ncbi:hypothetical protein [Paenibacillus larvae]|uniref:Uncharacterized protein n=1 Tax=Paenibacillus larvae subsp. larvae TaxID=147375 RepID=A0A6C0QVG3_9BACL|nr:hypothetical protein [Paenibacillus larvae]QHZ52338.1 hypothetical protein ERICV_03226 [Paenibacillus larvae subsp. larvae]
MDKLNEILAIATKEAELEPGDDAAFIFGDGWAGRSLDNLLWRLCGKYEELESAIRRDFEITRKAVHVANFAMMIADRCGEEEV